MAPIVPGWGPPHGSFRFAAIQRRMVHNEQVRASTLRTVIYRAFTQS